MTETDTYTTTRTCWRCRGVGSIDAGEHGAECPTCKGGGRLRDRITTIADEANGPHPVQSADESLTCIEAALTSERLGRLAAERERDRLRAVAEAARAALLEIARPGVGPELHDTAEERADYWAHACEVERQTARDALAALAALEGA